MKEGKTEYLQMIQEPISRMSTVSEILRVLLQLLFLVLLRCLIAM